MEMTELYLTTHMRDTYESCNKLKFKWRYKETNEFEAKVNKAPRELVSQYLFRKPLFNNSLVYCA